MRLPLMLGALLLAACGSVEVTSQQLKVGTHRLEYQPGGVEARAPVINALEAKAGDVCPEGWTKVRQGKSGDRVYDVYWVIECT